MPQFKVLLYTMCGWQDAWSIEDKNGVVQPERFQTIKEAKVGMAEYIEDWNADHDEDDQYEEGTLGIFNAETNEPIDEEINN